MCPCTFPNISTLVSAKEKKPQTESYQHRHMHVKIQSSSPLHLGATQAKIVTAFNGSVVKHQCPNSVSFRPVCLGWGARSALELVEDNMIRGSKPSLDFKQVNLSKLYVGANYINFPQQPNTYFISISHKRWGPGILFRKALITK